MGIAEDLESPQCATCGWKDENDLMCSAYPFGIPPDIIQNRVLHDHVLEDQFGSDIYTKA